MVSKYPKSSNVSEFFSLICHICDEDFKTKGMGSLINHCKQVHDCKPEITCICGKQMSSTAHIYKHKRKCLSDYSNASYECDICGVIIKDWLSLVFKPQPSSHPPIFYRLGEPPNILSTITWKWLIKLSLRKEKPASKFHLFYHKFLLIIPFSSSVCSRQFTNRSALRKHQKTQHIPEEERIRIPCSFDSCGLSFISKKTLETHIKLKHQSKRDYICHICSSGYLTKSKN